MGFAPEVPTTETLKHMHPLSNEGRQKVYDKRQEISSALQTGEQLLAVIGPCAMTEHDEEILEENRKIEEMCSRIGIVAVHRVPPWKPRSDEKSWHGRETTNPEGAHRLSVAIAEQSGNLAMEFGCERHIGRYATQTAFGWRGSRNDEKNELLDKLVHRDETLPVAIKNGMSGHTTDAIREAALASLQRVGKAAAPVVMIFRGGEAMQTPESWTHEYTQAFRATEGMFVVDVAHGSEMAFDPSGTFGKSAEGQLACLDRIIEESESTGRIPHGVMIESSNIPSPTDPVVPLEETFERLKILSDLNSRARGLAR